MRTNLVAGEAADGEHHCVYIGPSADEALSAYAKLQKDGGWWSPGASQPAVARMRFTRAICAINPRTSKHCSFADR